MAEVCDGVAITCPANALASTQVACGTYGHYRCSGTSDVCPTACVTNAECFTTAPGVSCRDERCINGKWAFVTSSTQTGGFGGLDGGDAICNRLAADAGLSGSYRAWLGTDGGSPSTRFVQSTVPWYQTNGVKLVDNWADLIDGTLDTALSVTERRVGVPTNQPSTNVSAVGGTTNPNNQSCDNWTSSALMTTGNFGTSNTTGQWTQDMAGSCSTARRLYCFEQ